MKILHQFETTIRYSLSIPQMEEALTLLNLHYLGEENCNHMVDGRWVAKYPDIEMTVPEFKNAHYNAQSAYNEKILVNLMEDGTLRIADR